MTDYYTDLAEFARRYYRAFEVRDRGFFEAHMDDDFTFTSPYDDHIDREAYFERCWPNGERVRRFHFDAIAVNGDTAFVLYRCEMKGGDVFRNAEMLTFERNRLKSVDVFFGDPPAGVSKAEYPDFIEVARQAWVQRLHSM
ncbi:MAG TPA: nuclear transport factor 2 family protein [Rhizomicrobium sp.]|nr:nuclear transport factor 2 family protein [Rhizomicrobium sp.]